MGTFLDGTLAMMRDNARTLAAGPRTPQTVQMMFRHTHTVKGTARTFGLQLLVDEIHGIESTYQTLDAANWDEAALASGPLPQGSRHEDADWPQRRPSPRAGILDEPVITVSERAGVHKNRP